MRRIKDAYNSENIAEIMIPMLKKMGVISRLGYFIKNNVGPNDICWRVICRKLRLDIKKPNNKKVKCLGYILNLVVKAFFFNKNADVFEEDINSKRSNIYIKKLREL